MMGYVKNVLLVTLLVGLGVFGIKYFDNGGETATSEGQVYGLEYGQTIEKLQQVNRDMEEAERLLSDLATKRQELIKQGDQIIEESYLWAHKEGSPNNQPAYTSTGSTEIFYLP